MKTLIKQIRGVSYKPDDLHDKLDSSSIMLLRANNIENGRINFDDVVYVDKHKISNDQILRRGDILICASSGSKNLVGKAATVNFDNEVTFGAFCKVVRPINDEDSEYISLFFQSPFYRRTISSVAIGININNIRNEHIDALAIQWLSKKGREKAVQVLSKVDLLIRQRQQQLKQLDDLIKARFVEMFGTIQNNVFGFADGTLESISDEFFAGGDKPADCITEKDSVHSYPVFANGYENEGLQGYSAKCRVNKPAVTVSARGTIGYCFIRDAGFTPVVRLVTIVPNNKVSVVFLKYAIDTMEIKSSGTSQAQLTVPDFKRERIIVPPIQLQEQFSTFVSQIDKSKSVVQKALDEAQLLFNSLMQQYFG